MKKNIIEQKISDTLETNYMPYAMSVIISRAIPEIDGFKPSHRKLLYTMYKMGLLTGNRTKSANVVGQTMKLNPHGDMAIYETMVRLTRGNDALLHPFVDSKGNFGKRYSRDMAFAAPRYTEVKLDEICSEIFRDLDKNTVDMVDNYDGTLKEPLLLPTTFPNILVSANQGIAVGMASNLCSFNLVEICETTMAFINDESIDLVSHIKAPDFSSGGQLIYNEKDIRNIYETGRGGFKLRAKYKYDKKNNCIEITEIPYTTTSEAIIDAVIELVKSGKIKEITDVRDETDLSGLKITFDLRRSAGNEGDAQNLMNKLFKLTPLEDSFSCNFNILVGGNPKVLGIKGILEEWTAFRMECIRRQAAFDIDRLNEKLHLLLGLKEILLDLDKAIKIIRGTAKDPEVVPNLMKGFGIDGTQAEFIADIKLRNLNKDYILKRISEVDSLRKEIADLESMISDNKKIKRLMVRQLGEIIKKYGKPRRTEIISDEHVEVITEEHFIEEYNLKLFLTDHGYLKKIPLTSLRVNPEQKIKEDDQIIQDLEARNKSDLLLFSSKCNVYKMKIHEIDDCKASSLGEYLPNLLGMDPEERILYITSTDDYSGMMLFAFENGKMAKVEMSCYETKTNRKKLTKAFSDISKPVWMMFINEDLELAAFSSIGKVLIFNTATINGKTTRDTQGVQVMNSRKKSTLKSIKHISELELKDMDYYRTKNIPATGYFIKEEDRMEQIELI